MRLSSRSPILDMYKALVAAGLEPTVRLNRRTLANARDPDGSVVWEMVQLRPDLFAAHFNDVDHDPRTTTFFGSLAQAVTWLGGLKPLG